MNNKTRVAVYKNSTLVRNIARSGFLGIALITALAGCTTQQKFVHGTIINQDQIDLVPIGSSREQVLLSMGTPSTTGTFENEVFYYISQSKTRNFAWQKGKITDQRIFSVYFDENSEVARLANYGLQDGKVFDFISRTTPTGGKDRTFLGQLLQAGAKPTLF